MYYLEKAKLLSGRRFNEIFNWQNLNARPQMNLRNLKRSTINNNKVIDSWFKGAQNSTCIHSVLTLPKQSFELYIPTIFSSKTEKQNAFLLFAQSSRWSILKGWTPVFLGVAVDGSSRICWLPWCTWPELDTEGGGAWSLSTAGNDLLLSRTLRDF